MESITLIDPTLVNSVRDKRLLTRVVLNAYLKEAPSRRPFRNTVCTLSKSTLEMWHFQLEHSLPILTASETSRAGSAALFALQIEGATRSPFRASARGLNRAHHHGAPPQREHTVRGPDLLNVYSPRNLI
jgi:hypothetical protein